MKPRTSTQPFRAIIAGGGVAALEAAITLRYLAGERLRITLLTPQSEFVYRPLAVREPFSGPATKRYPLAGLIEDLRLEQVRAELEAVDPDARTVSTSAGETLPYDALLLAIGARPRPALEHVLTLDDRLLDEQMHGLIQDVEAGISRRLAFIVPPAPCWPLPIYELALMTAKRAYEMGFDSLVTVVTPEPAPLAVFGSAASSAVAVALSESRVSTVLGAVGTVNEHGHLHVQPADRELSIDRVVALPALHGPIIPGIPLRDEHGFVSVDDHGAVRRCERIFAAGDLTDFPIKHGGIAAQQAAVAAEAIAALAGVPIDPRPLRPTLSGILFGGRHPLYLRARLVDGVAVDSQASEQPLWPETEKVAAPSLAAYLESLDREDAVAC